MASPEPDTCGNRFAAAERTPGQPAIRHAGERTYPLRVTLTPAKEGGRPLARPVFILGKHRSGTTWLANLVCELPGFVGVQHAEHFGIHESGYFHYVEDRFGDLADRSNYDKFVEAMAASDYFRLARADSDYLETLWPTSYPEVLGTVMNRFASMNGAACWVEKSPSHTPLVDRIAGYYPDAVFVSVRRDLNEVLVSALAMWAPDCGRLTRLRKIARISASWAMYEKCIKRFASRSNRILLVRYDVLSRDPRGILAEVCALAGVPYDGHLVASQYASNTSFPVGRGPRSRNLRPAEIRLAGFVACLIGAVPAGASTLLYRWRHRRASMRPLPSWFFTLRAGDLQDWR